MANWSALVFCNPLESAAFMHRQVVLFFPPPPEVGEPLPPLFSSFPVGYFSRLQLPSISMRREVSARPEEPVTPLLHEPSPPQGNREGALSFPNVDKLVSQFVRVCFPTETVPCYFPFLAFLRDSPKAKCRARKDKTPSKDRAHQARQRQHLSRMDAFDATSCLKPYALGILSHSS